MKPSALDIVYQFEDRLIEEIFTIGAELGYDRQIIQAAIKQYWKD